MISAIHSITSTPAQRIGREMAYRATVTLNSVLDKDAKNAQKRFNNILSNGVSLKSKPKSNNFINGIKNGWNKVVDFSKKGWNKVVDFSKNVWNKITDFSKKAWNWTKEKCGKVKEFFTKKKGNIEQPAA